MKKSTKIIFICLIAMIFCTILFSMQLVGSAYARYKTTVSNSDNARVAKFNITQSGTIFQEINVSFPRSEEEQPITLEIKNDSEVAVEYVVTVTNVTGNFPTLQFVLKAADENTAPITTSTHENGVSTNKVYRLPGNKTDTYTLDITLLEDENNLEYMGMVDYITISVTATQVD